MQPTPPPPQTRLVLSRLPCRRVVWAVAFALLCLLLLVTLLANVPLPWVLFVTAGLPPTAYCATGGQRDWLYCFSPIAWLASFLGSLYVPPDLLPVLDDGLRSLVALVPAFLVHVLIRVGYVERSR